jgi:hypothetical protein
VDKVSGRRGFGAVVWFAPPPPAAVFSGLARIAWLRGSWIFHFGVPVRGSVRADASDSGGRACVTWGRLGGGRRSTFFFFPLRP